MIPSGSSGLDDQSTNSSSFRHPNMENMFDIHDNDDDCNNVLNRLFDSDEDDMETRIGGSVVGRAPNIEHNLEECALQLYDDYFSGNPTYPEHIFARRYRMSRRLFTNICERLETKYEYFKQHRDATARKSLTTLQKCIATMGMLAYGTSADSVNEYE